jgi:hypothetical protein
LAYDCRESAEPASFYPAGAANILVLLCWWRRCSLGPSVALAV